MHRLIRFITLSTLMLSAAAWGQAPSAGTVFEGDSVPGIALGDSRAEVEASVGAPDSCQSTETAGDRGSCNFPVEGGGTVSVRFRGDDGGNPANSASDVVHAVRWYEAVSGWVTTAGIDTALAAADPDAVLDAYPNAEVNYNMFGGLYSAIEHEQGVEVYWVLDFYTGRVNVNMAIFGSRTPPEPVALSTRVTDIELSSSKKKGRRTVRALVQVRDQDDFAAAGATLTATWTDPNGVSQTVVDVTSLSGYGYFEVQGAQRGTYTLTINSVSLEDYEFDADASVLSASVEAR